jgi:hypothetical protein
MIVGIAISFFYSWELSLITCGLAPLMLIAGIVESKTFVDSEANGDEKNSQGTLL